MGSKDSGSTPFKIRRRRGLKNETRSNIQNNIFNLGPKLG
jgi:hypothetical protein